MFAKLNVKQWFFATVAVFFATSILGFIIHAQLLSSWYAEVPQFWRTDEDMMSRMHWMYIGYATFAALFCYIFALGHEGKSGLGEGLRYGFLIGLLLRLPMLFLDHAVFPMPVKIIVAWTGLGIIEAVIYGLIAGMIYKGKKFST